MKDKRFADVLF